MSFTVRGTKKGSFAISVQKRPMGKKVTVLTNVTGAGVNELLSALKKKLGTGGTRTAHDTIEVAGDRAAAVEKVLRELYPDALVGVRKPASATVTPATPTATPTPRREPRAKPRQSVSTQARMPKIVVLAKPKETSKTFDGFKRLLSDWYYWDRDVLNLHEMFDRHVREHDASSLLEDWPTEDSALVRDGDRMATRVQSKDERRAALSELGMISSPSAFKMSRLDRRREAAISAAASKRELSSTTGACSTSSFSSASSRAVQMDPAAELLREHGFAPARGKRITTTSHAHTPKPAPKVRIANSKTRARPTGGMYTSLRKGVGAFSAGDSRFAENACDSSSEDDDVRRTTWRQGFETGFSRDASGKFTFGDEVEQPLPEVRTRLDDFAAQKDRYKEDEDDADLIEAMRRSQIDYDANQHVHSHTMHVECDELFAGMSEEEILRYVEQMSMAEETLAASSHIEDDPALVHSMPSRTEWIEHRLGELFYPNMDSAREVAQLLPAMIGVDMTLDLLEGAGASRDEAKAFYDAYASLTLTDAPVINAQHSPSTTRGAHSSEDDFAAWANAALSKFSDEAACLAEFLVALADPIDIAEFLFDAFPTADRSDVDAFSREFAARASVRHRTP